MTKNKMYRYLGRNGILNTKIHLDGINYIDVVELIADPGKVLTNGEKFAYIITVEATEVDQWTEIADKTN